jgi:translation initiation factor IF-2
MTGKPEQDATDRRALVSAFAGHVGGPRAGTAARILGAVLIAALVGGGVVGVGYMTRPAKRHPAAAAPAAIATGAASPAAVTRAATPAPAAPAPAAPAAAAPLSQPPTAPGAPAGPLGTIPAWPTPAAAPRSTPRPPAAQAAVQHTGSSFAAVAGYGCPNQQDATFTEHGRWTQGLAGFIPVPEGAPRTGGCRGSFDAMPMSGSATADDPANYALWMFRTGPIIHGVCHINVYIPDDPSIEHVGGNPAVYQVFGSAGTSGTPLGSFEVDQPSNRGRWASRHNWRITGGELTVKLLSRGIDWTDSGPTHAHIAISAVSLTCAP